MKTINEQLNIPNIPDGMTGYMPNLYNGNRLEAGRDYNNAIIIGGVYRNADGSWNNVVGDCAGITASTPKEGVVACVNGRAVYIPAIWASLKLTKKGRAKIEHNRCVCLKQKEARKGDDVVPADSVVDDYTLDTKSPIGTNGGNGSGENSGLSNGAKIGIGVGVVAVVGLIAFLAIRKK